MFGFSDFACLMIIVIFGFVGYMLYRAIKNASGNGPRWGG